MEQAPKLSVPYIDAVRGLPEPIFITTADGVLLEANASGRRTLGLSAVGSDIRLASLLEDSEEELKSLLGLATRTPSSVTSQLVWQTPAGSQTGAVTLWCGRPASAGQPAVVIIRWEQDETMRFTALRRELDFLKAELLAGQRLRDEMADALKARDDFVAVAAHELRNPLNVFRLTLQLLYRMADNPGSNVRGMLDRLRVQLDRLSSLVDHLLDVARIRAGKLQLDTEMFELSELVRQVCDRFAESYPGNPIILHIDRTASGKWDRLRVDQALSNLLSNAIKYGLRKPITVTVAADAQQAQVSIRDEGVGLGAEDLTRIFDRFERAVPQSNREGLGLGLWITRRIVQAHGGAIAAQGQPGLGAVFTLSLPLPSSV